MNQVNVAGLDIDMIDICIDNLRNGKSVELLKCDDIQELKQYLNDEDVMVNIIIKNNRVVLTPLQQYNFN